MVRSSDARFKRLLRVVAGTMPVFALLLATGCVNPLVGPSSGVYVVRPDGTELIRVAPEVAEPVWSPDGSLIAFAGQDGIYTVHPDGSDRRRIVEGVEPSVPSWSPDGRRLAFVDRAEGALVIRSLIDDSATRLPLVDDAEETGLTAFSARNRPAWSPDGTEVAFIGWDGHGDEIEVVSVDGERRRAVTRIRLSAEPINGQRPTGPRKALSDAGSPAWSPDGNRIAYAVFPETAGSPGGIYVSDTRGVRPRRLVGTAPRWGPLWSPDATSLMAVIRRSDQVDLYTIDLERRTAENLTQGIDSPVESAAWSPVGGPIVAAIAGTVSLVETGETPEAIPGLPLVQATPSWSPNGELIAFSAAPDLIRN